MCNQPQTLLDLCLAFDCTRSHVWSNCLQKVSIWIQLATRHVIGWRSLASAHYWSRSCSVPWRSGPVPISSGRGRSLGVRSWLGHAGTCSWLRRHAITSPTSMFALVPTQGPLDWTIWCKYSVSWLLLEDSSRIGECVGASDVHHFYWRIHPPHPFIPETTKLAMFGSVWFWRFYTSYFGLKIALSLLDWFFLLLTK